MSSPYSTLQAVERIAEENQERLTLAEAILACTHLVESQPKVIAARMLVRNQKQRERERWTA